MKLQNLNRLKKNDITHFFIEHWGSPEMVLSTGIYQCDQLDGFVMLDEAGRITGLVTYIINESECEIVSLDSLIENQGIGSTLVRVVEEAANAAGCRKMRLITTNDNIHALGFYQKRGYRLSEVFPNAVDAARKRKPEIPFIAENRIPIRDEIVLVKFI